MSELSADHLAGANWTPPEVCIVVPTYNESGNIASLYEKIAIALQGTPWEMIVVDDNSPDHTIDVVRTLSRQHSNLRGIRRVGRRGLSSACIEGILATAAPYVAVIDADHQHDERILPEMLALVRSGADIAVGSRFVGGATAGDGLSATRLWGSRLATRLSSIVTGQDITDPMSGFFLLRRDEFNRLAPELSSDGFKILLDLLVTARQQGRPLAVAEVPYTFRARFSGESKMNSLIAAQFVGLWFSKLTRGAVPTTFVLFAAIGISGIGIHLLTLWLLLDVIGFDFTVSQIGATLVAMTTNFFFNNTLTYADKKLSGRRLFTGLIEFYAICSIGGLANVSVAAWLYQAHQPPLFAGVAGALMSSVFNYTVTRAFTWR
ncbi:glycosyltransferase family 2 protein [Kaistia dalseonensis]|uniref:Dolichol-phosphate mannosyltransferase n=1 Tax=Kaistia dalseonensis TaxID=410840 RepID=A0ABU0HCA1_9HYPH|nr:glycosyltransferase family 2 protein [Kaistia dalseonensis]MCX5496976.1 glycosyltransferase family 2 protein [Kaistia dalseonensis]MDQ0439602.1 dolichol-phosphate mannosyltransferase [Kaistia dalseonensis]